MAEAKHRAEIAEKKNFRTTEEEVEQTQKQFNLLMEER